MEEAQTLYHFYSHKISRQNLGKENCNPEIVETRRGKGVEPPLGASSLFPFTEQRTAVLDQTGNRQRRQLARGTAHMIQSGTSNIRCLMKTVPLKY